MGLDGFNAVVGGAVTSLRRPLRLDKWGLLGEEDLDVHLLPYAGPMTGVEGLVERRHDDQRQQG